MTFGPARRGGGGRNPEYCKHGTVFRLGADSNAHAARSGIGAKADADSRGSETARKVRRIGDFEEEEIAADANALDLGYFG
jgi:hypothetical protein